MSSSTSGQSIVEFILWVIVVILLVMAAFRLLGPFLEIYFGNVINTL